MTVNHKGFTIVAERANSMGGWEQIYYHVTRDIDAWVFIDSFMGSSDYLRVIVACLKKRVDEAIETHGESECLDREEWDKGI